jgi:uroporphyrin-III C-methyltransferase
MSSSPAPEPIAEIPADALVVAPVAPLPPAPQAPFALSRPLAALIAALVGLALLSSGLLWQKLSTIQEQLARQSADSGAQAIEARALARQAQDLSRETAARQAVTDARLSEVALQRTQLEELIQSMSRSRDENLVVDIESAVRLAQQQAQLTGSVEPLLAALRTADQRVQRAAQPRLSRLQRSITKDIERIRSATITDLPALLGRLDDLMRMVDDLPVANAVAPAAAIGAAKPRAAASAPAWWQRGLDLVRDEARNLVRVNRIDNPEAALLSPDQAFFARENMKLRLLNARLGLLARQLEPARADLSAAQDALNRYFDPSSRRTQAAATALQQAQTQMKLAELPRIDETLAALATAAAGR